MSEKTEIKKEIERFGYGIRHLQIACMCLCGMSLFVVRSSMGIAILAMTDPKRQGEPDIYPWDKKTQGIILSSFFWGYTVSQIPAGLTAKRFGGKPTLQGALFLNMLCCLALPIMTKYGGWPMVCLVRVATGATQSCLLPSIHTLLGQWLPSHEVTSYSGLVYGCNLVGVVISFPVSGYLASTSLGWKSIFYSSAALLFCTSLVWWFLAASTPANHRMIGMDERAYIEKDLKIDNKKSLSTPWLEIIKCKGFIAILAPHFACAVCFVSFFVDIPSFLEKGLNMSLQNSSIIAALPYIGMLIGTIFSTYLSDILVNNGYLTLKHSRKMFNSIAFFGAAIGLLGLTFISATQISLAIFLLVSTLTLFSFISAGFMINHIDLSPNYAGVMMSISNGMANIGSIITPIITSVLLNNDPTDVGRWRIVFGIIASVCIFCNAIYLIWGSVEKQPWDDPKYMDKDAIHEDELKPVFKTNEEEKKEENEKV